MKVCVCVYAEGLCPKRAISQHSNRAASNGNRKVVSHQAQLQLFHAFTKASGMAANSTKVHVLEAFAVFLQVRSHPGDVLLQPPLLSLLTRDSFVHLLLAPN